MSTTASTICTGALLLLGVIDPEDTPTNPMLADAYRRLQMLMGSLALQPLTRPVSVREVFPLDGVHGGPTNPYTIGPGGTFNTTRPPSVESIQSAGLLLNPGLSTELEIPRGMLTNDAYAAIQTKNQTITQLYTNFYYSATFPLGTINTWPIVTTTGTSLVLYRVLPLTQFVSLTASYDLPLGADETIEYNLARRLLDIYSVDAQKKMNVMELAKTSLAVFKRSNTDLEDQPLDPIYTGIGGGTRRGGYNINTGNQ